MIPSLMAFLLPIATGFILSCLLLPHMRKTPSLFLLRICLGSGIGIGASSCGFFLLTLVFGISLGHFTLLEFLFLISFTIVLVHLRKGTLRVQSRPSLESRDIISSILSIVFSIMLILSIVTFAFISLKYPHGWWDAWSIWNLRARFLFRAGSQWEMAFSPLLVLSHPDYPLLLPCSVVRGWLHIGKETLLVPVLVAVAFTYATVGLLFSSLSILQDRNKAMMASICLLGTPFFIFHGASQCADVPLAFYFLGVIVSLALWEKFASESVRLMFVAGLLAGMAVWTKNEGALFLLALLISSLCVIPFKRGWKTYGKVTIPFCLGLLPVLIIVVYFKMRLAPPNDLLAKQGFHSVINKLIDPSRYTIVSKAFLLQLVNYKNWNIFPLLFLIFLTFRQNGISPNYRVSSTVSIGVMIFILIGYYIIYVLTPKDLDWHIWSSLSRILLQIWPSIVFVFFMTVGTDKGRESISR